MSVVDTTTGEIVGRSLDECEQVIERGLGTFVEVGEALMEIRDSRLYKTSHASFDDYCRERWGFTRRRSSQLIDAAEIVAELSPIGDTENGEVGTIVPTSEPAPIPTRESQVRELNPLRGQPDKMRKAIEGATEAAKAEGGQVTARHIRESVKEVIEETAHPSSGLRDVSAPPEQRSQVSVEDVGARAPLNWSKERAAKKSDDGRDFCAWMDRRTIRTDDLKHTVESYAEKCPPELIDAAILTARSQAKAWEHFATVLANRTVRLEVVK